MFCNPVSHLLATMVRKLRSTTCVRHPGNRVAVELAGVAIVFLCLAACGRAQEPAVHYWHAGVMPPGAIGSRQLQRGGPLPGFFQPVEIKAPAGVSVSLAVNEQFLPEKPAPQRVGLLIGAVYRLRVTNIPRAEGIEVFPTIEIIDRTYAPASHQVRFAVPVEIAQQDLELAIEGKFVTRVIYLEDPHNASPNRSGDGQSWFEVSPGHDPLAAADQLGRPVAILRMGGRVPNAGPDPIFYYGSPPWVAYPPRTALEAKPVRETSAMRPAPAPPAIVPPNGNPQP